MTTLISLNEARAIAIASQGITGETATLSDIFDRVKCIQIDPVRILRESHELICKTRNATSSDTTALLTINCPFQTFIYPAHAMAILPVSYWPYFAFQRRKIKNVGWKGPQPEKQTIKEVRELLAGKQSIDSRDFVDRTGTGWDRVSKLRIAAEWLLWTGECVSPYRNGLRKQYFLCENVVPSPLLNTEFTDEMCLQFLVEQSLDALGIATLDDISDYFRLDKKLVLHTLNGLGAMTAEVEGWEEKCWISKRAFNSKIDFFEGPTLLSMFDSLIWHRPRLNRLFKKNYLLEAYKKSKDIKFGRYFVAVLSQGNVVGRISANRISKNIEIDAAEFDEYVHESIKAESITMMKSWGSE